jgi:hypothetical protein
MRARLCCGAGCSHIEQLEKIRSDGGGDSCTNWRAPRVHGKGSPFEPDTVAGVRGPTVSPPLLRLIAPLFIRFSGT